MHKLSALVESPQNPLPLLSSPAQGMGPLVFQKQTILKPDSKLLCCVSLGLASLVTGDKEGYTSTSLNRAAQPSSLRHSSQAELWRIAEDTWGGALEEESPCVAFSAPLSSPCPSCLAFLCPPWGGSCPVSPLHPFSFVSPWPVVLGTRCGDSEVRYRH